MTDKHTSTPWPKDMIEKIWLAGINKLYADGELGASAIVSIFDRVAHANATHIVKCVNMHDELVEALRLLLSSSYDYQAGVAEAEETLKKAGAL